MDIINYHNKIDSNTIKTKKGRIWNLEKVSNHRIEIRTMGGKNYHLQNKKVLEEFDRYREIFIETLKQDSQKYKNLKQKHLDKIAISDDKVKVKFAKLFLEP